MATAAQIARLDARPDEGRLLVDADLIEMLRLDAESGDPRERLRNLIRRHGLPCLRVGRLRRYRARDIEAWLGRRDKS